MPCVSEGSLGLLMEVILLTAATREHTVVLGGSVQEEHSCALVVGVGVSLGVRMSVGGRQCSVGGFDCECGWMHGEDARGLRRMAADIRLAAFAVCACAGWPAPR